MLNRLISLFNGYAKTDRVSPRDAHEVLSSTLSLLVDVRTIAEFESGHAKGAVCIPLNELDNRAVEIPHDRPVYVICAAGSRSAAAAKRLKALGYDNTIDIQGGTAAWQAAGLPITAGK